MVFWRVHCRAKRAQARGLGDPCHWEVSSSELCFVGAACQSCKAEVEKSRFLSLIKTLKRA